MVSKILEKDSGARRDGSKIRVALAAMLSNVQFNKKDILIIDLPFPFGLEKSAATAANSASRTALNLPYPQSGSNRHGESIMIDWPHA
jgi:hypothetical protein